MFFLTSNIGGYKNIGDIKSSDLFFSDNDFLENLKNGLKSNHKFVLIASDPLDYKKNDMYLNIDKNSLEISGLVFDEYYVLDNRNISEINDILKNVSLIFLSGGDTYIQNKFFNYINLKRYLNKDMIIVGISAGSINMATISYNSPECKDDLIHSSVLNGLGLTDINIEPHFVVDDLDTDDKVLQREDILKESYNRIIYALPDKSYILISNGVNKVYGKCYKIEKGVITLLNDDNQVLEI